MIRLWASARDRFYLATVRHENVGSAGRTAACYVWMKRCGFGFVLHDFGALRIMLGPWHLIIRWGRNG